MTTRQMISICISSFVFSHPIGGKAMVGAVIVFGVLFYQIRRKYLARKQMSGGNAAPVAAPKGSPPPGMGKKKNSDLPRLS